MPNHVLNRLVFSGQEADIARLEDALFVTDGDCNREFTFQKIEPRPEILDRTVAGGFVDIGLIALGREDILGRNPSEISRMSLRSEEYPYDLPWIRAAGVRNREQLLAFMEEKHPGSIQNALVATQAFAETGFANWYDWSVEHWGTKWDAYDSTVNRREPGMLDVSFLTAWSPPVPFLEKLVRRFPDVALEGHHLDEMPNFAMMSRSDAGVPHLLSADVDISTEERIRDFSDRIHAGTGRVEQEPLIPDL